MHLLVCQMLFLYLTTRQGRCTPTQQETIEQQLTKLREGTAEVPAETMQKRKDVLEMQARYQQEVQRWSGAVRDYLQWLQLPVQDQRREQPDVAEVVRTRRAVIDGMDAVIEYCRRSRSEAAVCLTGMADACYLHARRQLAEWRQTYCTVYPQLRLAELMIAHILPLKWSAEFCADEGGGAGERQAQQAEERRQLGAEMQGRAAADAGAAQPGRQHPGAQRDQAPHGKKASKKQRQAAPKPLPLDEESRKAADAAAQAAAAELVALEEAQQAALAKKDEKRKAKKERQKAARMGAVAAAAGEEGSAGAAAEAAAKRAAQDAQAGGREEAVTGDEAAEAVSEVAEPEQQGMQPSTVDAEQAAEQLGGAAAGQSVQAETARPRAAEQPSVAAVSRYAVLEQDEEQQAGGGDELAPAGRPQRRSKGSRKKAARDSSAEAHVRSPSVSAATVPEPAPHQVAAEEEEAAEVAAPPASAAADSWTDAGYWEPVPRELLRETVWEEKVGGKKKGAAGVQHSQPPEQTPGGSGSFAAPAAPPSEGPGAARVSRQAPAPGSYSGLPSPGMSGPAPASAASAPAHAMRSGSRERTEPQAVAGATLPFSYSAATRHSAARARGGPPDPGPGSAQQGSRQQPAKQPAKPAASSSSPSASAASPSIQHGDSPAPLDRAASSSSSTSWPAAAAPAASTPPADVAASVDDTDFESLLLTLGVSAASAEGSSSSAWGGAPMLAPTPALQPVADAAYNHSMHVSDGGSLPQPIFDPSSLFLGQVAGPFAGLPGLPYPVQGGQQPLPPPEALMPPPWQQQPTGPTLPPELAAPAPAPAPQQQARGPELPPAGQQQAAGGELCLPGLRNEAGEYNCFLNVILQCLWHCRDFRQQVLSWPPELVAADAVVGALHGLMAELQQHQAAAAGAEGSQQEGDRGSVVDPSRLRAALADVPGSAFGQGEMSDAGEVLLTVYECILAAEKAVGVPPHRSSVEATFGLHLREWVWCGDCQLATHHHSFMQCFYDTQAAALRSCMARLIKQRSRGVIQPRSFGGVLGELAKQFKTCDSDIGGCDKRQPVRRVVEAPLPRIFTLQIAWQSHRETPHNIAETMGAVQEQLWLRDLFRDSEQAEAAEVAGTRYRLASMVCYYGRHYFAFLLLPASGGWVMMDDAASTVVGGWPQVLHRCEAGRIQPSLLFYEAAPAPAPA